MRRSRTMRRTRSMMGGTSGPIQPLRPIPPRGGSRRRTMRRTRGRTRGRTRTMRGGYLTSWGRQTPK